MQNNIPPAYRERFCEIVLRIGVPAKHVIELENREKFFKLYEMIKQKKGSDGYYVLERLVCVFFSATFFLSPAERSQVLTRLLADPTVFQEVPMFIWKCTDLFYSKNTLCFRSVDDAFVALRAIVRILCRKPFPGMTNSTCSIPEATELNVEETPVVQPIAVRPTTSASRGVELPDVHDPTVLSELDKIVYMFCKTLQMTKVDVLNHVVTPEVSFVAQRLVEKADSVRRGSLDWRLIVLSIVRHLVHVPQNKRKKFLQNLYAFASVIECPSLDDLLEVSQTIVKEHKLPAKKIPQLKNLKKVLRVLFGVLRVPPSSVPDELYRAGVQFHDAATRKLYTPARSFICAILGTKQLEISWFEKPSRKKKRKRDKEAPEPNKRSKSLSASSDSA